MVVGTAQAAGAQPAPVVPGPALSVTTVLDGLSKPWDVVQAPDGAVLTGERSGRFVVSRPDGSTGEVTADLSDLFVAGETGLMGIALSRDFAANRTLYTCQGHQNPGPAGPAGSLDTGSLGTGSGGGAGRDVRVVSWTVDENWTQLTRGADVLTGLPVGPTGRHGGCRVLAHPDGTLYIGAGDSASPTVPQDPASLGGKVLHVNTDGTPAAGNPDPGSPVFTLGHRNVQGLALQPGTGRLYGIEQGTRADDEVNLLTAGGNYGYRPDRNPLVYDESVPMTDPDRVPGAIAAVWSSGAPTIATPGGTFLDGASWGEWAGTLVVTSQQAKKLVLLRLAADGRSVTEQSVALEGQFGRLRSATLASDGALLLTTDNGSGDKVLRVTLAS
ncbi:PQQ-dependent sugar dehydrogenase [Rhodococcus gannanensis]|uniref:PQQ-dependent sugar dehydrogenase n=1 Tax=Rhodococcus gannanensis TaxID=1960308 RepID=A0ABW4PA49_9NOCA